VKAARYERPAPILHDILTDAAQLSRPSLGRSDSFQSFYDAACLL
jgi:hypothetical protein